MFFEGPWDNLVNTYQSPPLNTSSTSASRMARRLAKSDRRETLTTSFQSLRTQSSRSITGGSSANNRVLEGDWLLFQAESAQPLLSIVIIKILRFPSGQH